MVHHVRVGLAGVLGAACVVFAAAPGRASSISITGSPYHLLYPMAFVSTEWRVARHFGVASDFALGRYHSGSVGEVGLRAPLYVTGSFEGGLQLGPFVRQVAFHYSEAWATAPPEEPSDGDPDGHGLGEAVYHDVEFARANGRAAVTAGLLFGGKYVVRADSERFGMIRGFTMQAGFLLGYQHFIGTPHFGPDPHATRKHGGLLPEIYVELGYSL